MLTEAELWLLLLLGMAALVVACVLTTIPPFLVWLWGGPDNTDAADRRAHDLD